LSRMVPTLKSGTDLDLINGMAPKKRRRSGKEALSAPYALAFAERPS
jgi:hypothetical protein